MPLLLAQWQRMLLAAGECLVKKHSRLAEQLESCAIGLAHKAECATPGQVPRRRRRPGCVRAPRLTRVRFLCWQRAHCPWRNRPRATSAHAPLSGTWQVLHTINAVGEGGDAQNYNATVYKAFACCDVARPSRKRGERTKSAERTEHVWRAHNVSQSDRKEQRKERARRLAICCGCACCAGWPCTVCH